VAVSALVDDVRAVRARLAGIEPALLPPGECAAIVHEIAGLGKACSAVGARLAARAAEGGAHRELGFLEAADWLASEQGTSSTTAKRELEAAAAIDPLSDTRDAVARGELSLEQGQEIAKTEVAVPGSERALLDLARTVPLRRLRDTARQTRLRAQDVEALALRQRRLRRFRHWTDDDGMIRFAGALTPQVGVPFLSRVDAETERLRVAARRESAEEDWEAHAVDAVASLVMGRGRGTRATADVVFVCDVTAYRAGGPGHVVGGGPVPNSVVRDAVAGDAFLKVAFHDGVEVQRVKHFGRHVPAELRTALELGPPPAFDGVRCACGCGKRYKLQRDHIDPVANGGSTSLANLQTLTAREHGEKTRQDRRAGLLSGKRPP
jgi:HAMP domain-containing protein